MDVSAWEEKLDYLTYALEAIELKSQDLVEQLRRSEDRVDDYAARLRTSQHSEVQLKEKLAASQEREMLLKHEVARLEALLEAQRLQSAFLEQRMQCALAAERATVDRLRSSRDDAVHERDKSIAQLAAAYADMDALQAVLADSVVYVRFLRRRVGELEQDVKSSAAAPRGSSAASAAATSRSAEAASPAEGVFSLASVKAAVGEAVKQAAGCSASERKRRIRSLQLRWHPDKNPVLKEFATEVTKLINEAVAALQADDAGSSSDSSDDTVERRDSRFPAASPAAAPAGAGPSDAGGA